jgi:hypothetical protein
LVNVCRVILMAAMIAARLMVASVFCAVTR